MNKLFPSIVIMCASLGISNSYAIKEIQVSNKIISHEVLSKLTELRRSGKLTAPSCIKYDGFGGKIEYTLKKGVPNQDYDYKIIQSITEQAFNDKNQAFNDQDKNKNQEFNDKNRAENIINECRKILHLLYRTTSDPQHLQSSRRFVVLFVQNGQDFYDCNCNSTDKLPSKDRNSIKINKSFALYKTPSNQYYYLSDLTYDFEEIRQSAFMGNSEIFDEIFEASSIWYDNGLYPSNRCKIEKAFEKVGTLQTLAEDLCHLVALSLMLWYNDNPDFELILSTSEG